MALDGGRTGDGRDRMVVDDRSRLLDDIEPRTKRAINESMDISSLSKGGHYEVQSASGNRYESTSSANPVPAQTGSNEHQRIAVSICVESIAKSSRGEFLNQMIDFLTDI